MLIRFEDRGSDSPLVERVWRSHSEGAGIFHSMAQCHWGIVVSRVAGRTTFTVRGPETMATTADCPADGEWMGIHFALGTFMPLFPTATLRDRQDVSLPEASGRSFWLHGSAWEYPDFENAETFVRRLARAGLVVADGAVQDALRDAVPRRAPRTAQRHVLRATGMTRTTIRQIERARRATILLQQGMPRAAAAAEAGYFDQAHLTRALRRFVGRTPAQVAVGQAQLSLLYNTDRD